MSQPIETENNVSNESSIQSARPQKMWYNCDVEFDYTEQQISLAEADTNAILGRLYDHLCKFDCTLDLQSVCEFIRPHYYHKALKFQMNLCNKIQSNPFVVPFTISQKSESDYQDQSNETVNKSKQLISTYESEPSTPTDKSDFLRTDESASSEIWNTINYPRKHNRLPTYTAEVQSPTANNNKDLNLHISDKYGKKGENSDKPIGRVGTITMSKQVIAKLKCGYLKLDESGIPLRDSNNNLVKFNFAEFFKESKKKNHVTIYACSVKGTITLSTCYNELDNDANRNHLDAKIIEAYKELLPHLQNAIKCQQFWANKNNNSSSANVHIDENDNSYYNEYDVKLPGKL